MRVKLSIDAAHSRKLLRGDPVVIKVPKHATELQLRLAHFRTREQQDSFAKICDVVFNGRPA